MTTLYGIKNCDSVKKAQKWLAENDIEYKFHDFKKDGITQNILKKWSQTISWEILLNKRGTTYRNLETDHKTNLNSDKAIRLMQNQPTLIKRPVLEMNNKVTVGFDSEVYAKLQKK